MTLTRHSIQATEPTERTWRRIISFFILVGCILSCTARAQEGYIVTGIEFSGNNTLAADELKDRMTTYATGWFRRTILRKEPFQYSEEILRVDLERLVTFYQTEGYLRASAELLGIEADHGKQSVKIRIGITEGKPVLVRNVDTNVITDGDDDDKLAGETIDELEPELTLGGSARFRDQDLLADQQLIIREYSNSGFPYTRARYKLDVIEDRLVDIAWYIETGPRCFIGNVDVIGNDRVSTSLIKEQLLIEKGQLFRRSLIEESQKQIYDLGMFHVVSFRSLLTEEPKTTIPILINIREAPRWSTKFGLGYGTEDRFRATINATRLGFLGGARRLTLFLHHSGLEPYHVSLKFVQPAFPVPKTTLFITPYIKKETEPGYTVERDGFSSSLIREISRAIDVSVTYIYERVNQDTIGVSGELDTLGIANLYNKSSTSFGFKYDGSLPLFFPEKGWYTSAYYKVSGLVIGSDYSFRKLLVDFRKYTKVRGSVLALRLRFGNISSWDEPEYVPPEERFYSGGEASVRGWKRSQLGPKDPLGDPLGGKSLLEGSCELRFPFTDRWSVVAFLDFGNVWIDPMAHQLNDLRYAAGAGVRFRTPVGPLRLDVARPIFDEEHAWVLHFSVGHAF